jgi:hypothetical protein
MRIRSSHIVYLVLALIAGFVVVSVQLLPEEGEVATGSLPPEGAAPGLVPVIELETREVHLGTLPNDQITRAPLTVYNRGKAPLELRSVKTSCACTQGEIPLSSQVIAPGTSAPIILIFDPARVPGFTSTKRLTLFSNDFESPQLDFDVTGDIEPEFVMSSREVDFGAVSKGALPTHTLVIRQAQETPLTVTGVEPRAIESLPGANDLELSWELRPEDTWTETGMREYAVKVALPPDVPPGEIMRLFDVINDIPRLRRLPVPVRAIVSAPYGVEPAFPHIVAIPPGLAVISATQPITVESVESNPALFEVEVRASEDHTRAELMITPSAAAPAGAITGTVRFVVHTGGAAYPEKVLVRGIAAGPTGR